MLEKINNFEKFCRDHKYEIKDQDCVNKLMGLGFKPVYSSKVNTWPLFVHEFYDDTAIIVQIPSIDLENVENNKRVGRYQLIDHATETYDITFVHDYDEFSEHYNVARCMGENMKKPEMETLEHFENSAELLAYIKE